MFGAAMAIYTPTTDKPRRMNRMPAIYTQFHKTAKCFKSTLYLALSLPFGEEMYQIEKLPFGSLLCVQNNLSFRVLSRRLMDRHIARTRPQLAAFLRIFAAFFFSTTARAVKRCDRFIITGKSVLYFKSSGKVNSK